MDNLTAKIFQTQKTIFTNKDLALIWQEKNRDNLKAKIAYYIKTCVLFRLSRGIFAKDKNYNLKELANSIYLPSYISFETVLREAGIIFQHYNTIFVAGPWSKTITIDEHTFTFRKLKNSALYNTSGVINQGNYSIASSERAFLDTIYLFSEYYFDNLKSIDWTRCFELVEIYGNKELAKRLKKYHKNYAQ